MKPKQLIILLSLVFFSTSVFGQYTYTQKLGSLATIKLPDTPQIKQGKGARFYISRYNGVLFMAQVGDIGGGLNPFHKNNSDSIYNDYIRGILEGTKGQLFYKDKIKIQDHEAFEFGYKAKLNNQQVYRYNRVVFLNDTLLMCGVWSSDSLSKDHPNLVNFFNGFKTKSIQQISSENGGRMAYKVGQVIGYLIILAIVVAIGLAVVYLIRKIAYRNKK